MPIKESFQVGDKVVASGIYVKYFKIGVVETISNKRNELTVKFDQGNKMKFTHNGYVISENLYDVTYIEPLTPEIQQIIDNKKIVNLCRNTFIWVYDNGKLTGDQARKIMEILKNEKD